MFLRIIFPFCAMFLLSINSSAKLSPGSYEWFCEGRTYDGETWEMLVNFRIFQFLPTHKDTNKPKEIETYSRAKVTMFMYNGEDVLVDSFVKTTKLKLNITKNQTTYEYYSMNDQGIKVARAFIAPSSHNSEHSYNDHFEFQTSIANGKFKNGRCLLDKL